MTGPALGDVVHDRSRRTGQRIILDKDSDALYFRLDDNRIVDSEEIKPGAIVDYDANDRVVGVEFLNVSSRTSKEQLSPIQFQLA